MSQIAFLKNEIFQLYKDFNGSEMKFTESVEYALDLLQDRFDKLLDPLEIWTTPEYKMYEHFYDDPYEVPDLNGVPESHYWWINEHRKMSKEEGEERRKKIEALRFFINNL